MEKKAVDELEQMLASRPALTLPRSAAHYTVDNNGCSSRARCVFPQKELGGNNEPVATNLLS